MAKAVRSASRKRRKARRPQRRKPASRTRALEATLAALAHDIRTPLTGILALSELLATSELAPRERGWAKAIKGTAEYLALLTSLIVDAARAGAKGLVPRLAMFRPRQLADALAVSLAARAGAKDLAFEVAIAADLPEAVIGDALRLRGVLENLIDNAVKFTDRGSVRLDVTWQKAARGRVRLVFAVTDSGIGLKAAEIRRLFRPFAQANDEVARRYGGAGLGLAFVKRIAKAMDGDLAVVSRPGGGSTFRLTVAVAAVADAKAAAGRDDASATRAVPLRALDILCVEDNPYGRVVLNTILTELGHRVDFVGTGEAAVAAVAGTRYDAVLMDVTLPGIDGFEATRRIRALAGPRVPGIGVSGRDSADEERRARAAGMDHYLPKPISPGALARVLESDGTQT
ncbi:MAG: two-component system, sensor histidine kinase [Alphaproteobacteria bacterium]|nr:two-component system, sensor histidine kinase [Alphaproteobacteria bacterium]